MALNLMTFETMSATANMINSSFKIIRATRELIVISSLTWDKIVISYIVMNLN